jgi:hypothetical protein
MSGVRFVAQTDEIATGTSKKTLLQLVPAANHRVLVKEWSISFTGITNTDAPIQVEIARQSDAGTASALTLVKQNADDGETLESSAQHTATAEPTETNVIMRENVHPQGGYTWQAPFGQELVLTGDATDRLAIVVTAAVGVNAVARFVAEE